MRNFILFFFKSTGFFFVFVFDVYGRDEGRVNNHCLSSMHELLSDDLYHSINTIMTITQPGAEKVVRFWPDQPDRFRRPCLQLWSMHGLLLYVPETCMFHISCIFLVHGMHKVSSLDRESLELYKMLYLNSYVSSQALLWRCAKPNLSSGLLPAAFLN